LETLPSALTLGDADVAGLRKDQVDARLDVGERQRMGRGMFVTADSIDSRLASLTGATVLQSSARMCLWSTMD